MVDSMTPLRIGDRVHVRNIGVEGLDRSWDGEVIEIDGSLVKVTMPGLPRDYLGGWAAKQDVIRVLPVLDLFSGIRGFSRGLKQAGGYETAAYCEIDPYRRQIIAQHDPNVPIFEDVNHVSRAALDARGICRVGVITAGFPCQPVSGAAGRYAKGIHDPRWLWPHVARLVRELRPEFVIVENAPELLTVNDGAALGEILGDLASLDYDAEVHVLPASAFGAWHQRERLWLVAYPSEIGLGESEAIVTPPPYSQRHIPPSERVGEAELYALVTGGQVNRTGGRWQPEPGLCGVVDGVSDGLHQARIEALGDSIVPIIPEHIGRCINKFRASRESRIAAAA